MSRYVSIYPVTIAMRNTNVYEERSLGIYANDKRPRDEETSRYTAAALLKRVAGKRSDFLGRQIRNQFFHDLLVSMLGIIGILWILNAHFEVETGERSYFKVIFETMAAYSMVFSL